MRVLAAGAVVSALRHQTPSQGHYVAEMAAALLSAAESALEEADEHRRLRIGDPTQLLKSTTPDEEEGADLTASDPLHATREALSAMHQDMLKDREEILALWWVFGAYSTIARRAYRDMNRGTAAVLAGVELAEIVRPPAALGITALASRAVSAVRNSGKGAGLRELLAEVDEVAWQAFNKPGSNTEYIERFTLLFPISFIACRRNAEVR